MNKQEFLQSIRKQIHFVFDRDSIEKEYSDHLDDSIFDYMSEGYPREEAEQKAIEQMGDPIIIGKLLNQEHHPILGYLWVASKAVLGLLIIPAIILIGTMGYDVFKLATPTTQDYGKQITRLDIDFDVLTHDVTLDYLYNIGPRKYSITYRSWRNFEYSRTGWSSSFFSIEAENGHFLHSGGYNSSGIIGSIGYREFDYPENGIINIRTVQNEIITIDLKEYIDETK